MFLQFSGSATKWIVEVFVETGNSGGEGVKLRESDEIHFGHELRSLWAI